MGLPLPHEFDGRVLDELFIASSQTDKVLEGAANAPGGIARSRLKRLLED
jgi:hypothetical protein